MFLEIIHDVTLFCCSHWVLLDRLSGCHLSCLVTGLTTPRGVIFAEETDFGEMKLGGTFFAVSPTFKSKYEITEVFSSTSEHWL